MEQNIQQIVMKETLTEVFDEIKKKGYKIVTVSELIYKDNYVIDANGVQKQSKNE